MSLLFIAAPLAADGVNAETGPMRNDWMNTGSPLQPGKEFFLPELCLPQALLVLVVLAELLVLVLVLVEHMRPDFNWVRMELMSLFVQWIVLLSAALLCGLRPWLARLRARSEERRVGKECRSG